MIRGFGKINRADYEHLRQPAVHRIIVVQLVVCVLLLLVLQPLGSAVSLSAFLGGLCYALPNASVSYTHLTLPTKA